jgi:tetratricopeptide (TPR) repeat protein
MVIRLRSFKYVVAALVLSVGFSAPVVAQSPVLDDLFDQLQTADPMDSARIESRIFEEWGKSGSPTVDLLLRRGQEALARGDFARAVEHFTAVIDHAPDFAEGYNGRATAFFQMQRYGESVEDIRQTLLRNPRHFGAMIGLGVIFEELGKPEEALTAYYRVQALAPAMANVQDAINRLEQQLTGQSL